MSSNTKLYVNQYNQKNDELIATNRLMATVKNSINELIKDSYEEHNIKQYETNISLPFIRNAAILSNFNYEPSYHEDLNLDFEIFRAQFSVFRSSDNWNAEKDFFATTDFKLKKEGAEIPHASRYMQILTKNNFDAANTLDKNFHAKDSFVSFLLGDDEQGQDFMKKLGEKIQSSLGTEVYYIRTDLSDDPAVLLKGDKEENKNNQKRKMKP